MTTHANQHSRSTQRRWGVMAADQTKDSRAEAQQPQTMSRVWRSMIARATQRNQIAKLSLLSLAVLAVPVVAGANPVTFRSTFDKGLSGWRGKEACCSHSLQTVTSPIRLGGPGSKALKVTFKKTDATERGEKRAEVAGEILPGQSERWYAVSMYFPQSFKATEKSFIVTQWHDFPDKGENWKIPPLYISTDGKRLNVGNRWDTRQRKITPKRGGSEGINRKDWDLGPLPKGRWIDFVVHAKWSHKSDGVLEVFKDGKKVVSKTGPNTYWDDRGPYWKLGMYASGIDDDPSQYDFDEQVIYFDRARMGEAQAGYKGVAVGE